MKIPVEASRPALVLDSLHSLEKKWMPPQNYAIAVEGVRKDTGLEIPNLREISKKLGNEAQLKTFGTFTLLLTPDRIYFV